MTSIDERLEEARKAEAEEEEKRLEADKLRELLVLDLRAKGRAECGNGTEPGRIGRDFQVIDFPALDKVVLLQRAAPIVVKRYQEQCRGKAYPTDEQTLQYVVPSVLSPERDEFKKWAADHPQVAIECAYELKKLEGLRVEEKTGKP
jgi:hypothetical protein